MATLRGAGGGTVRPTELGHRLAQGGRVLTVQGLADPGHLLAVVGLLEKLARLGGERVALSPGSLGGVVSVPERAGGPGIGAGLLR